MNNKGFSLLELIIYIAVLSVIIMVVVEIFFMITQGRDLANVKFEVSQNIRFATERVRQMVFDADLIAVSGSCPNNILEITAASATSSIFIENGVLKISDNSGVNDITTAKVIATSTPGECLFGIVNNPAPIKNSLQMKIKMVYNSQGKSELDISESQQMTVSLR